MARIRIIFENIEIQAELYDTKTAKAILQALPLESNVQRWGDEIYFYIPVRVEREKDAKQDVAVGDIAYWPDGPALCLFFGRTPASTSGKPRAYSPVNVFGKFDGKRIEELKKIKGGKVRVKKVLN